MRHLLLLGAMSIASASAAGSRQILVTTFEPFDGAAVNSTAAVARALATLAPARGLNIEVCTLPVEFGRAADAARRCFDHAVPRPDLVLSLGEGFCNVTLETRAHNLKRGGPDNRGVTLNEDVIAPNGPPHLAATLPFLDMYCALDRPRRRTVEPSVSPGFFVCNEVAFAMSAYLGTQRVPYGFTHVPSPGACRGAESAEASASKIATMLEVVLHPRSARSTNRACRHKFKKILKREEAYFRIREEWRREAVKRHHSADST